jgi:hypothetical protein
MRDDFPFDKRLAADFLADTETTATVLHMIMLAAYGDELHGNPEAGVEPMDPVECWVRVSEDFRVSVPESNENKINALMLALSTNAFYDDPVAFVSICNALYSGDLGDLVDGVMEDLTMPEMLWGIYEVELNRGDYQDFVPSIDSFINEVITNEAEDNEELEVEEVVPYYESFVKEMRDDMLIQMRTLGVEEKIIKEILKSDLTPAKELDAVGTNPI